MMMIMIPTRPKLLLIKLPL